MSVKFDDFLQEQLKDPEFYKEYKALQPERAIIQAIIDARQSTYITAFSCWSGNENKSRIYSNYT